MPVVYRGMKITGERPVVADNDANALGVRSNPPRNPYDVITYLQGQEPWVRPLDDAGEPQGMSVATGSGCNLPPFRRPPGAPWNGTSTVATLRMWQLDTATLVPAHLVLVPAPLEDQPEHCVISPAVNMPLATYRGYLAGTVDAWALSPAPAVACAAVGAVGGSRVDTHLVRLADAVASGQGQGHDELVAALVSANRGGLGRAEIVAGLEAATQRASAAGDEDGAEAVREVLDRIYGYCAPAIRITLT